MSAEPASEPGRHEKARQDAEPEHGSHLTAEDVYGLLEDLLPRRKRRRLEAHAASCSECVETIAMVLRADRPASREEQAELAATPEPSLDTVLERLRPVMGTGAKRSRAEWKPVLLTAIAALVLLALGLEIRTTLWLPAAARHTAEATLDAFVELRQGTGRVPLRYIPELERAGVVRSNFDTTDETEEALLENLEEAIARTREPEPDALLTLGLLELDAGRLDDAEKTLGQVLDLRPKSAEALNGLAVLHYERAQLEPEDSFALLQKGLALLRDAARLEPDNLMVAYNFGGYYEAMSMPAAAIKAWERYLEKDRSSEWAEEAVRRLETLAPSAPGERPSPDVKPRVRQKGR